MAKAVDLGIDIDTDIDKTLGVIQRALRGSDKAKLAGVLASLEAPELTAVLERLSQRDRVVAYQLLPPDLAWNVISGLDPSLQADLIQRTQDDDADRLFGRLRPDDRVSLLDQLPTEAASRLLRGLPPGEREQTEVVLSYPAGSIGRRMSPRYVAVRPEMSCGTAVNHVRSAVQDAETIYTIPVVDDQHGVVGVVSLRELMRAEESPARVGDVMRDPHWTLATTPAETAARRCADLKLLALLVINEEGRMVGILTVDDALRILEEAESEDQARIAGSEPLRRPYFSTPVRMLVRSRVVWLLVLAVGATFTVQVLEVFEGTLSQMVVLSVFIPLLIGTGGNAGNQAATTVTRALALNDVRPRDILKVVGRELLVGASLGLLLGALGFAITSIVYGLPIGAVIGLTLLSICTLAATVGGAMPLLAKTIRADPAVFSNPFITTFVDATGLIIYFLIARQILNL